MIYEKLLNGSILSNLSNLASLVASKTQERLPTYGSVRPPCHPCRIFH